MRTGQRDNKIDNKGFSIVELVIVIAIMAILVGSAASIMISVSNTKVKSCAQSVFTDLSRVKNNTMAKATNVTTGYGDDFCFYLYKDGDDIYIKEMLDGTNMVKKIGERGMTVTLSKDGSNVSVGSSSTPNFCKFNRDSGSIYDADFDTFRVTNDHVTYEVSLYKHTGKIKMTQIY